MAKSCIPGYEEAIEEERRIRENACLGDTVSICGIKINHVTPFLLARLFRMNTPFMAGGEYSDAETIRFLWAMSVDFCTDPDKREEFILESLKRLSEFGFDLAEDEIDSFLNDTFMDAPQGGGDYAPVVSSPAWLVYKMMCKPLRWTEEKSLHTPIRRIYQYIRCHQLEKGHIIYNPSDKLKADWSAKIRDEWLKSKGQN